MLRNALRLQPNIRASLSGKISAAKMHSFPVTANPLPASFLRGGTSKGIFLNRDDLPEDRKHWDRIFLGIMGSPDPEYGRQLNGMGGGVSSLSKICVVEHPTADLKAQGIDIEYTFVQVGIRDSVIDYSGNCGNLSSMIGVFALDQGLCKPSSIDEGAGVAVVRSFNRNTMKRIDTTFPVATSGGKITPVLDLPQVVVAGVPGKASQIVLDFVSPGGARTGKVLPTERPIHECTTPVHQIPSKFRVSLVDATNPTVFITSEDLRHALHIDESHPIDYGDTEVRSTMEYIRQHGAVAMGLDPVAQAQPKIAVLSPPSSEDAIHEVDVVIHAFSMGVLHKAVPMTVGLCLGVASRLENTLAWEIVQQARQGASRQNPELIRIRHPGGLVDVGAEIDEHGEVKSARVIRTGRRLMTGHVWW